MEGIEIFRDGYKRNEMEKDLKKAPFADDFRLDVKGVLRIDDPQKEYMVLVRQETGSWKAVEKANAPLIGKLSGGGLTFGEFKKSYPGDMPLLQALFKAGVLRINGKASVKEDRFDTCLHADTYPSFLVVKYTRECNLRCAYCYAASDKKEPDARGNDLILHILTKMLAAYGDREFCLALHGGEPTLKYKEMQPLVRAVHALSPHIRICLQTNATLVTEEMARFFKKERIGVGVSLDGFDELTNIHRRGADGRNTWRQSLQGIGRLLSAGVFPGLLTVVTPANQYHLVEHFDFYVQKGIRRFVFNPFFPAGRGEKETCELDMDHLVATHLRLAEKINELNAGIEDPKAYVAERGLCNLIRHLTSWNRNYMCALSPCGAGRMTLAFDGDGSVYPCDNFISEKDFCMGNIYAIEDIKKAIATSEIARRVADHQVNHTEECAICPWKRICTFHCASDSYFYHKAFNRPHSLCSYVKKIIPPLIDLLYRGRLDPRRFLPG